MAKIQNREKLIVCQCLKFGKIKVSKFGKNFKIDIETNLQILEKSHVA